jgi:putative protein-disulfide isomerase
MCSWCWGFRPVWLDLQEKLKGKVIIKYVLGGLAPDSDVSMPTDMQAMIRNTWKNIQREIPGTQFNYDFWAVCSPRRSTYPACRAIVACRMQQPEKDNEMLLAIQQAYYLQAKNPSDVDVLTQVAESIGLNPEKFSDDLISEACQSFLQDELQLASDISVSSFPSLVYSYRGVEKSIHISYNDSEYILQQVFAEIQTL